MPVTKRQHTAPREPDRFSSRHDSEELSLLKLAASSLGWESTAAERNDTRKRLIAYIEQATGRPYVDN